MPGILIIVVLVSILIYVFVSEYRSEKYITTDHVYYESNQLLDPYARIIDVKRKKVRSKGKHGFYRFCTTILFSDGLKFISHKTKVEDQWHSYRISIPTELFYEIMKDAMKAHDDVVSSPLKSQEEIAWFMQLSNMIYFTVLV